MLSNKLPQHTIGRPPNKPEKFNGEYLAKSRTRKKMNRKGKEEKCCYKQKTIRNRNARVKKITKYCKLEAEGTEPLMQNNQGTHKDLQIRPLHTQV